MIDEEITFSFHREVGEGDDKVRSHGHVTLTGDKATYYPDILEEFAGFLRSLGFTYISSLQAYNEEGDAIG